MRRRHLFLALVLPALALAAPVSGQEPIRTAAVADRTADAPAPVAPALDAAALERRIAEARQSYRRNRLIGGGLVTLGAAALVGSMADWAGRDRLGMTLGASGIMLGGIGLLGWGADRHRAAGEALSRARALDAGPRR